MPNRSMSHKAYKVYSGWSRKIARVVFVANVISRNVIIFKGLGAGFIINFGLLR